MFSDSDMFNVPEIDVPSETQAVDGGWSNWTDSENGCSIDCGGGILSKKRTCSNPAPEHDGDNCTLEDGSLGLVEYKNVSCNEELCNTGGEIYIIPGLNLKKDNLPCN